MQEMPQDRIALDRASVRMIDQDGHLHVAESNISKAVVNPYRGSEIPDAGKLGLEPNKVYYLLRDPKELEKAADTFNGKPLLIVHKPQTAEDHDHELVVGSVNNVRWDAPFLKAELTVWDGSAIAGIESGEQRELSSAYRYTADMAPGEYEGVKYDGVMRNIAANHIALVSLGRAGRDVVVGDAALQPPETPPEPPAAPAPDAPAAVAADAAPTPPAPPTTEETTTMAKRAAPLSRAALYASGALRAYVKPKLAADAALDLGPVFKGVTASNWLARKPAVKAAFDAAVKGKLAADEELVDVQDVLDDLDAVVAELEETVAAVEAPAAADPAAVTPAKDDDGDAQKRLKEFLSGKGLSDEDIAAALTMLKPEVAADAPVAMPGGLAADPPGKKAEEVPVAAATHTAPAETLTKTAMDAAIAVATTKAAQAAKATIAEMRAIQAAEREVRPFIGELAVAQDSAAAVYKLALDHAGIELDGVPEVAYGPLLRALPKPSDAKATSARPTRVAMDAAAESRRAAMFPNANRLKH